MKPQNAFLSLKKYQNKFTYFLIALFSLQLIFFLIASINIPINDSFFNNIFANITKRKNCIFNNVYYAFPDKLFVRNIVFTEENFHAKITNAKVEFNFFKILDQSKLSYIEFLNFDKADFALGNDILKVDKFELFRNVDFSHSSSFKLRSENYNFNFKGILEVEHFASYANQINSIIRNHTKKDREKKPFRPLTSDLDLNCNIFFEIERNSSIHILSNNTVNENNAISALVALSQNPESFDIDFNGLVDNFTYDNNGKFYCESLRSSSFCRFSKKDIVKFYSNTSITTPSFPKLLDGSLPSFQLIYDGNLNEYRSSIFSSEKLNKVCLDFSKNKHEKAFSGYIKCHPDNLGLSLLKEDRNIELLEGDYLEITIHSDSKNKDQDRLFSFDARAENFSVLESPPGSFNCIGFVDSNYSLSVSESFAKFGKSEATGSFTQMWNPKRFQFEVEGYCYPTDLNNWLPSWWDQIWLDFEFGDDVPYGIFSIGGIWGGKPEDGLTIGSVDSKNFIFKNLPINESQIKVLVDANSTTIDAKVIEHDEGRLTGSIKFPRKHTVPTHEIEFEFDGDYPWDKAKTLFGENFANQLSDINATNLECSAEGKIALQPQKSQETFFEVALRSARNINYRGLEIEDLIGSIFYNQSCTSAKFDKIDIAGGHSTMTLDLNQSSIPAQMEISLNFNEVNTQTFLNKFVRTFDINASSLIASDTNVKTENQGWFNLSIQAKGPASNHLQLTGSGSLEIKENDLSKIDLLNPITSNITKLPLIQNFLNIPVIKKILSTSLKPFVKDNSVSLPGTSISFNNLSATFTLNNGIVNFSPIVLSGALSRIESEGSLELLNGHLELISRINFAGNIPLLKIADPLSKIAEFKISGPWNDPDIEMQINPKP